jgi:hypothetical protein
MEFIDEASDAERRWPISRENSGEWAASRAVEKVTTIAPASGATVAPGIA